MPTTWPTRRQTTLKTASAAAIRRSEGGAQSDTAEVPEVRLVIVLVGILICVVSGVRIVFPFSIDSPYL